MTNSKLGVAVVGCGLIGQRRAVVAAAHLRTRLVAVCDSHAGAAEALAKTQGCEALTDWRKLLERADIDIVVVATPNFLLAEVGVPALQHGKHVLIEKPMGRDLAEALALADAAAKAKRVLKIGFNHRYHPALMVAQKEVSSGVLGPVINVRARYGHGGRPGYEKEWRGDRVRAGGGELTDQGVHLADLLHWFVGAPQEAFCWLQTAVWPLNDLEDNGFAMFRYPGGQVATFHSSWTQWKNLFSFEVFCRDGSVVIEGLGRSYGTEKLTVARRKPEGGVPDMREEAFTGEDLSWQLEWDDFTGAAAGGKPYWGTPADGVAVMRMIDALYRSAAANAVMAL